MAFVASTFYPRGPSQWQYKTTDSIGTCLGAGYFNASVGVGTVLHAGDQIEVCTVSNFGTGTETVTNYGTLTVTSVIAGTVTVTQPSTVSPSSSTGEVFLLNYYQPSDAGDYGPALRRILTAYPNDTTIVVPDGIYPCSPATSSGGEAVATVVGSGGITFRGVGPTASYLKLVPTANNQALIRLDRVSTPEKSSFSCAISNLGFSTSDATNSKVAIDGVDTSELLIDRVNISKWYGADSVGMRTAGRELMRVFDLTSDATVPIQVIANPDTSNGYLSADQWQWIGVYCSSNKTAPSTLTHAGILIGSGVQVTNWHIQGLEVAGTKHGVYWSNGASSYSSYVFSIQGMRKEQSYGAGAGYTVYLDHGSSHNLQNVHLSDIYCGQDAGDQGFYFRYIDGVLMQNCNAQGRNTPASDYVMDAANVGHIIWNMVETDSTGRNNLSGLSTLSNAVYIGGRTPPQLPLCVVYTP